jgi:multiple sugar transport system permease protein
MIAIMFASPLIAVLLGTFKTPEEAAAVPPAYLPENPSAGNYIRLWESSVGVGTAVANSVFVAVGVVLVTVSVALLAAYGFERYPFVGSETIFLVMLAAIMVPFQVLVSPLFIVLNTLGLTNSRLGLVVVIATFQLPFATFILRNSYAAIPREVFEAASVDGAGLWTTLRMSIPLVRAGLITAALFSFFAAWNEFFGALILISDQDKFTLPVVLATLVNRSRGAVDWGMLQTGVVITILPCLIVFIILQKYYVSGMVAGSGK